MFGSSFGSKPILLGNDRRWTRLSVAEDPDSVDRELKEMRSV